MITIKEIAKKAGVSPTTVSNVLHNRTTEIRPEKLAHVKQIISENGYVPNMAGKALAGHKSQLIGVILSTEYRESKSILDDGYHGCLVGSIEQTLKAAGYYMLLSSAKTPIETLTTAKAWKVDGLIILESKAADVAPILQEIKTPTLFIDGEKPTHAENFYNISTDDFDGGFQMANYLKLIEKRKILFISDAPKPFGVDLARYKGVKQVFPNVMYHAFSSDFEIRTTQIRQWIIQKQWQAYDALFFSSDKIASETMQEMQDCGINVPNDIIIVGYDDSLYARTSRPQLTTIRQNIALKGQKAVETLVKLINHENAAFEIQLQSELIIRDSSTIKKK
ncbi:LacI family DNA-binding transcriptional regulator [Lactococcus hircilactis]|uniref:LacI family DNA-binding transcriptional regulator n=1 Tax=Lactococcus hircilactis TaxID=1494462 RepID=A0A7X1ZB36_9LACT|nr:LacI family DNA-binding transcriptional regulator [Lactococcus hircilactis]MQW39825.1 LacI family DNA-binding transcriptional regulator [Lactococcus hircilactis]